MKKKTKKKNLEVENLRTSTEHCLKKKKKKKKMNPSRTTTWYTLLELYTNIKIIHSSDINLFCAHIMYIRLEMVPNTH